MIPVTKKLKIELYKNYIQLLGYGIDGYLERLILQSDTFLIEDLGFFSINENTLVGFHLYEGNPDLYKQFIKDIIDDYQVEKILFPSNDDVLVKALSDYDIKDQAYNFIYPNTCESDFEMILATKQDKESILNTFGEFLEYNEIVYEENELFYYKEDDIVCLGLFEQYTIDNRACVAMIVNEKYRKKDYGTKTLKFLVKELQHRNIKVNARCYVLNEASKRTLEKAGFIHSNTLLKIDIKKQHN